MMDTVIIGLQTNNTLIVYNTTFKKRESDELRKAGFLAKPTQQLTENNNLTFNSAQIKRLANSTITASQYDQAKKIKLLDTNDINKEEYVSHHTRGAYISLVCQPQVAFGLLYAM